MEAVRDSGEPSASNGSLARERRAIFSDGWSCARLGRPSREVDSKHPVVHPRAGRMSRGASVATRPAGTIGIPSCEISVAKAPSEDQRRLMRWDAGRPSGR